MYDVAILTEARYLAPDESDWYTRQIHTEDGLLRDALSARGLRVCRVDWADSDVQWPQIRTAIFRSTWDYFHRFAEFAPWLERASQSTRLFNEAGLIHWNLDKHYLGELEKSGIHIVPTQYIEPDETRTLHAIITASGWEETILKPVISGAARHTYRLTAANIDEHEAIFRELIAHESMMLQPFQRAITGEGELSLIVIDGKVTHAIRKTAQAGDFRVQDDWGGTVHPHTASPDEIDFAQRAVAAVPFDVLYARVDLIRDNDGQLAIMELEMIEPELFFRFCPEAADVFAEGLVRRLA